MTDKLELWQTEWCPQSHQVRQRLTELGISFVAHQVPVERDQRTELRAATSQSAIPALVAGREVISGQEAILAYLDRHFPQPPGAEEQRAKAAKAKRKELEAACPKFAAATP